METKVFVALRAFIVHQGKILIIRESSLYNKSPNKGKYDVVGGKVNPGERFDLALKREVEEEVGVARHYW
jgi:8-oxo-dGTP diphosphatase